MFRRRQGNAVVGGTLGVVMHDEYRVRDVPQPRGEDGTALAGWLNGKIRSAVEQHGTRRLW
jgi:hypothetical protein